MDQETLLDLEIRLKKSFFKMKTKFYLQNYKNKSNERQIYFSISINNDRERIPTGYYTKETHWNSKTERSKIDSDLNLVLDNMISKSVEIKTFFRLNYKELSLKSFLSEFHAKTPSYDFIKFMEGHLKNKVANENTLKKHKSIIKKLKDYCNTLPFTDINLEFFDVYRKHLFDLGNNSSTRNSNIKIIKYYLIDAEKKGIRLQFDLDDLIVGRTDGTRTSLSPEDTKRLYKIYMLDVLPSGHQLALGYFLISCFMSLRVSDILALNRNDLMGEKILVNTIKGKKDLALVITETAKNIINHNPELFIKYLSQQKINEYLKLIASNYKINRKLTMHVGRHTFATNYIKAGGTVENLQIILGHNSLETTMIYVHMDKEESMKTVNLLDEYFKESFRSAN